MPGTGKTVLVVDDFVTSRYATCRVLRQANYTTLEAGTASDAVLKAHQHHPDAIVLDVNLPDESGMAILKQLRNASDTKSIPVVFLTATAQTDFDRSKAEALGASAYLFSPVPPDTLLSIVGGIIERGVGH